MRALTEPEFRSYLATLPDGLLLVPASGDTWLVNQSARDLLGFGVTGALPGLIDLGAAASFGPELAQWLERRGQTRTGTLCRTLLSATGGRTVAVAASWVEPRLAATLIQERVHRERDVHDVLVTRLQLTADLARVAGRAYRGLSNLEIGRAFKIPVGTVKRRLHEAYRHLGIGNRTSLVQLVDAALGATPAATPAAGATLAGPDSRSRRRPPLRARALEAATWARLRQFVDGIDVGYGAVDPTGRWVWANAHARALLQAEVAEDTASLAAAIAGLIARPPRARRGRRCASLRLTGTGAALRALVWRDGPGLLGVKIHEERVRSVELEDRLQRQFDLSPQQARVAVLIGRGLPNAEVARVLGVCAGTVKSTSAAIYERLGVRGRVDLAAMVGVLNEDLPRS